VIGFELAQWRRQRRPVDYVSAEKICIQKSIVGVSVADAGRLKDVRGGFDEAFVDLSQLDLAFTRRHVFHRNPTCFKEPELQRCRGRWGKHGFHVSPTL
jgi:hypothetical protein